MTPEKVLTDVEFDTMPSTTYGIDFYSGRVASKVDQHAAMRQAIYKILNTERYRYPIYSWNYGIELEDLFGMPVPYVCTELERRISEALEWDDRINSVDSFNFDLTKRNIVSVSFTCHTIFGDVQDTFDYNMNTSSSSVKKPEKTRFMRLTGSDSNDLNLNFYINDKGQLVAAGDPRIFDVVDLKLNDKGELEAGIDV